MKNVVVFVLAASIVWSADFPMTLLSEDEAEPIHSAIIRKEAWTLDAVRRLRAEAEKRLKEGPWTVTSDRPKGFDPGFHEYYSEAPNYWPNPDNPSGPYILRDGQTNPNRFLANRTALNSMCDAVFTLGTAAFLLDEPRYAQRASRLINTWFVNPRTRMEPDLEFAQAIPGTNQGRAAGVMEGRCLIRAIQGMEFLAQTGSWDGREQLAVHKWFDDYLHWLTESKYAIEEKRSSNNHASWWAAQTAAVASYVENRRAERMVFDYYRTHLFPKQIRGNGSAPREESRTKSLSFSAFNLEAFTTVCRIAQVRGVDLWAVSGKGGATIGTVIEYLRPYLVDPRKWNREQFAEYPNEGLYAVAFAGMGLKNADYVALFRKLERAETAWTSVVDLMVGRWEAAAHQTHH